MEFLLAGRRHQTPVHGQGEHRHVVLQAGSTARTDIRLSCSGIFDHWYVIYPVEIIYMYVHLVFCQFCTMAHFSCQLTTTTLMTIYSTYVKKWNKPMFSAILLKIANRTERQKGRKPIPPPVSHAGDSYRMTYTFGK